jgi:hypothetical protein
MQVFIKITVSPGGSVGPNFSIVPNIGTSTPATANLTQLTSGIFVTLSDPTASYITVTSQGACNDSIILYLAATTTTSSSTTTSTTICEEKCYKLINTTSSPQFFSYYSCADGFINDTISPIGTAGSILYICSGTNINVSSIGVIVEEIFEFDTAYKNCPCAPIPGEPGGGTPSRTCRNPLNILFELVKSSTECLCLNDPSGPALLKNILTCPGTTVNLCNSGYINICETLCGPLFLGGRDVQQSLIYPFIDNPSCYNSPNFGDCCWVSAQSPDSGIYYCADGGISTTATTTCYDCFAPCEVDYDAHILSNCLLPTEEWGGFTICSDSPTSRGFLDALSSFKNILTASQYQDLLDLEIIESGQISGCSSLLSELYIILSGLPQNLIYEYIKTILRK